MSTEGARQLLAAALLRAVRDAQNGDDPLLAVQARCWLREDGAAWAEMLDIPAGAVVSWVERLPELPYEQFLADLIREGITTNVG